MKTANDGRNIGQEALTECKNIDTHIDTLLEKDFLVAIGADNNGQRNLHLRVLRIIRELNKLRGDDVDPHEHNYEPCPKCSYMTLPTRSRNCSNCHLPIAEVAVVPPPLILC